MPELMGRCGCDCGKCSRDVIQGLKMFAQKLVEKHGTPEYVSSWKYNGNAFKDFERADFSAFENM